MYVEQGDLARSRGWGRGAGVDENQMQLTVNPAQTVGSVTEEGGEEDGQAAP